MNARMIAWLDLLAQTEAEEKQAGKMEILPPLPSKTPRPRRLQTMSYPQEPPRPAALIEAA